jgi:hypothetical protein
MQTESEPQADAALCLGLVFLGRQKQRHQKLGRYWHLLLIYHRYRVGCFRVWSGRSTVITESPSYARQHCHFEVVPVHPCDCRVRCQQ